MRILVLEDNNEKKIALCEHIHTVDSTIFVNTVDTFMGFVRAICTDKYDLIVIDLLVPRDSHDDECIDITENLIEVTRDFTCTNSRTPGIVLTSYDERAEENFRALNSQDISVVTYQDGSLEWKTALEMKIKGCMPPERFDFVVLCALPKEVSGFTDAGYELAEVKIKHGLECRTIEIAEKKGVIVSIPRMGLVSCAITSTMAINTFQPQLICMSGICAGVPGNAKIYDVVVAEICHQHDSGKWSSNEFQPEVYSVSIDHQLAQHLRGLIGSDSFLKKIKNGISLNRSEFPKDQNTFEAGVFLAPASSGSAVVADESVVNRIKGQQRKTAIFEMESYALYEAARLSPFKPQYFSVKAVVDDGTENKGDNFHRVGCILSAKAAYEFVASYQFS